MKTLLKVSLILILSLILLFGCSKEKEAEIVESSMKQLNSPNQGDKIAVFDTDMGIFKIVLYDRLAPKAVENFITHANNNYYDGLSFHRVIEDFLIQSGDPTNTGSGGDSASMVPFENEYSEDLHNFKGAVGMAAFEKNQNKSQFYIIAGGDISEEMINNMKIAGYSQDIVDAYIEVGGRPTLDYNYTVFGQVYEGMDVVLEINKVKVGSDNRPEKEVLIKSVTIDTFFPE
jgi:peptidyl-prolyl cis-trans isomerase B (cyclophilin B)